MSIPLGPFDLLHPAGRGAMGEVWQARHRVEGVGVAVKVVTAPIGRRRRFRTAFAHELRAVARLDHPGIVRIYDHGEIGPEAAADGRLPAEAPYMAMEWIDGGSIGRRAGRIGWPELRGLLLALLDALGHAHARGVIHRDLKPDNILLAERGPVLTDFGVAFTAERHADGDEGFSGTPSYMSPEQVTGDVRALGPWSDLYALGCLACTLARGRPPFVARDAARVARLHLVRPPPLLEPELPVPEGFEQWMHRLLAKQPTERYRFAADAAVALMALPDEAPPPPARDDEPPAPPEEADRTVRARPIYLSLATEGFARGPDERGRPPVPGDWRRPEPPPLPRPLVGVGRALFALRPPTLTGRLTERDALWAHLCAVAAGEGARAVLVAGGPGQGKSRLAGWLARRAHELGAADVLEARHDVAGGPETGLAAMFARYARCEGLPGDARRHQLGWTLGGGVDAGLVEALAALLAPDERWTDSHDGVLITSAAERDALLAEALAVLGRRRPLVVVLEDLHRSEDSLGFVEHVLTARRELPVLFVGTLPDADLAADGAAEELLDHLLASPAVHRIDLGPLDRPGLAEQIQSRLPLDPALARRVVTRAEGNPLYAEALVEHWIRTGALEDAPAGFRLRGGFEDALPEGLHGLWRSRLADVLGGDAAPRRALECAAALGSSVDVAEWQAACAAAGIAPIEPAALDALLDAGLLVGEADRHLAFNHPLWQETLQDDARRAGRLAELHRACARALIARDAAPARVAGHLVAAGESRAALAPLLDAADRAIERKQPARARRALLTRFRALRALDRGLADRAWTETRVRWARLCIHRLRPAAAARHARRAVACADDETLRATALIEQARAVAISDDMRHGLTLILAAAERAAEAGAPLLEARARKEEGRMRLSSGDPPGAQRAYEQALALVADRGETLMEASLLGALGNFARRAGESDRARGLVSRARDVFKAAGSRGGEAHMTNLLGEIARDRGDRATAERHYRESLRLFGSLGSFDALTAEANLALVLVEGGRYAEARARFEALVERTRATGNRELIAIFRACLLPCLAAARDWAEWDATFAAIEPLCAGRLVEPDVLRCAERAAGLATEAGEHARAAAAWALVVAQVEGMGRDSRAARAALDAAVALAAAG
ncbi:MAG: protein kinase [bacterium]